MTAITPRGAGAEATIRAAIDLQMRIQKKTRRELATILDLSPQGITRRLGGETEISINELEKIANWLNTPIGTLLGDEPEPAQRSA